MIPTLGIMVAAYAVIRLIQIPIEHSAVTYKLFWLSVLSFLGVVVVGLCAIGLLLTGVQGLQGLTK